MEEVMEVMALEDAPRLPRVTRKKNGFSREDIVQAFQGAFEIIGGVDRLSLWAHANPDKFYPLYSKLLPSTSIALGNPGVLEIVHRLAPTPLDDHSNHQTHIKHEYGAPQACQELSSATSPDGTSTISTSEPADGPSSSPTDVQERQSQP